MATALTALATTTLASAASTVSFSSISGSYRDLVLICSIIAPTSGSVGMRFNGDTGSNYNDVHFWGTGSSTGSNVRTNNSVGYIGSDTTTAAPFQINIMDYTATDKHKTVISRFSVPTEIVGARAMRWASTAAITSLVIFDDSNQFQTGSTFSLYGVVS